MLPGENILVVILRECLQRQGSKSGDFPSVSPRLELKKILLGQPDLMKVPASENGLPSIFRVFIYQKRCLRLPKETGSPSGGSKEGESGWILQNQEGF